MNIKIGQSVSFQAIGREMYYTVKVKGVKIGDKLDRYFVDYRKGVANLYLHKDGSVERMTNVRGKTICTSGMVLGGANA